MEPTQDAASSSISGRDHSESWLESCMTVVLVTFGLLLLLGGVFWGFMEIMSARSSFEEEVSSISAGTILVAVAGLVLIITAFWKPRK